MKSLPFGRLFFCKKFLRLICNQNGNKYVHLNIKPIMRVIAARTLKAYAKEFKQAEQPLLSWHEEVNSANWNN